MSEVVDDFLERMQNLDPFTQYEIFHRRSAGKVGQTINIPNPYNDYKDTPIPILAQRANKQIKTMLLEITELKEKVDLMQRFIEEDPERQAEFKKYLEEESKLVEKDE